MAKTQLKNYVFKPGLGATDNRYPDAYSLLQQNKTFIQKESAAWIQDQIDAGAAGFVGYTYNQEKCERDVGYNIDAYLLDIRYGGNENTRNTIKYYWDQDVAQIDGDRQPEIQTYQFIKSLINTNILLNTAYSASNVEVTQTIDLSKTAESAAITELDTLLDNTVSVITSGLSSLPTLVESGVGRLKVQGRYDTDELLLITNTTKNEIIYNFSNPTTGGFVTLKTDSTSIDNDFSSYLQTTDAITTITLNYDTSSHDSTDDIQIFVEKTENGKSIVTTRPYDFGTDAIERMRVAPALSMLDADFEYGLQPTKWAAIGTMRGYPSIYEIPGTDTSVTSVTTDASVGTDDVGQSLITVTTVSAHGLQPGDPITIKALEDSVVGAARAEGSFVIVTVPSDTTFTYFAKSKVGEIDGDVLSTTYTQLRKAGFYTGADIGSPTFSVLSQGSSGTMVTELSTVSGSDIIPYDGDAPDIGAPITDVSNAIPAGAQVTGVRTTSAGGGTYITPNVEGDYGPGALAITVTDSAGVVQDLALDDGSGSAVYVSSVVGNTINLTDPLASDFKGNTTTYTDVEGLNQAGVGTGAEFDISRAAGVYTIDAVAVAGSDYEVGDRILITGDNLGGLTPDHDLAIIVDSVLGSGGVDTVTIEGTAFDGTVTLPGIAAPAAEGGAGSGARFDVTLDNNSYTVTLAGAPDDDDSTGYSVNDQLVITGDNFPGGFTPANDLKIQVTGIFSSGAIDTFTVSGTAPDASVVINNPPIASTTTVAGSNAAYDVTITGTVYSVIRQNNGINYLPTEEIVISGTELGGTSPTNDLTITIDNVDGSGSITAESASGVATGILPAGAFSASNLIGSGLTFNIALNAGAYSVAVADGGQDYGPSQEIIINGSDIVGEDVTNDLTVTISTVDSSGTVTAVTSSGTAAGGTGSLTNVAGSNDAPAGTSGQFTVVRDNGQYSPITVSNGGTGYKVGNRIKVIGGSLGGQSPQNDLILRVTAAPGGVITSVVDSYVSAALGDNLDLISTFTMSETTDTLLPAASALTFGALATLEIAFPNAHGLIPGNTFIVNTNTDDGVNNHDLLSGSFFATDIPADNKLRFQARAEGSIDDSIQINGEVYPRPDSFFVHRPYDGGVQLGTGGPQHGAQAIRQSKKYIRYQSGKGIMYTTGALFAPSYDLRSVIAEDVEVNSLITIVTDDNDHGVQVGGIIRLLGIETPGYNSGPETAVPPEFDYEVVDVVDERTFKIRAQRRLGATTAVLGFGAQMSVVRWHGATVRSGIFDDQNGIFWEFDGTQISVVQRTGTRQLAGTISIEVDGNLITGNNTRFRDQLKAGDRIIIKGMTHVVSHVISQTEITMTPDWRGVVDITGAKANLIVDKKVKQADFNLDRLDGTGPSGYDIDIAKMQMIGIQYSWYGAGFIDFMLRGADGNFVFAHRMRNSNVNTEAFMRSGNLPVRYEVTNEGPSGKLAESMDVSQTTIVLEDSSFFPDSGYVYIDNEVIQFTSNDKSTNTLGGCIRSATFTNFQAGATRSYTAGVAAIHNDRTGVVLISQTITPLISHWGSAFITDGGFDEDRGYIFSYSETGLEVSTTPATAFMIRLSPSVSNALVGDLGERELLNRAQLLLQSLEITSDGFESDGSPIQGGIVVEGILNPINYPLDVNNVTWSTLSSQAQGGQPSFAQIASSGAITWTQDATTTTVTPTTSTFLTGNIQIAARPWNGRYVENNSRFLYFTRANLDTYRNQGFQTNDYISHPSLPNDTRIRRFGNTFNYSGTEYQWVELTANGTNNNLSTASATVQRRFETSDTSTILFQEASWESANITAGTTTSDTNFTSANTQVNTIVEKTYFSTNYYEVTFTSRYSATINPGTTTIEFTFQQAPYAEPGETVFSFIAQPGERATVDFSELKELTNTPLGGRGTYPNGPDVLAVNVYKVSGAASNANVILNWGEAQA